MSKIEMSDGQEAQVIKRESRKAFVSARALVLCTAIAFALCVSVEVVEAQADSSGIFSDAAASTYAVAAVSPTHVRSRAVTVDVFEVLRIADAGFGSLALNLFDDATFIGQVDQVFYRPGGYSLSGTLEGQLGGQFDLTIEGGVVVGSIRDEVNRTFHIRFQQDGTHVVRQIDQAAFAPCGVTHETMQRFDDAVDERVGDGVAESSSARVDGSVSSADNGSILDLLVLYSDVTRLAAGGTNAIRAEIQLAVDVANAAYVASGIGSRLRLVHMDEVAYDEVTGWDGFEDHLVRLWDKDDGYFDNAHSLRDFYGADLISLFVEDSFSGTIGVGTCGIAPVMQEVSPEFESLALSAVNRECSADNWTLVHEIGHNQGCAHNRENSTVAGVYTYSYGYRFVGDSQNWRSIMAYDGPAGWERIGKFSSPSVIHDGVPTGVPIGSADEAHNVSTIRSTLWTISRFRFSRYWIDLNWGGAETGLFESPYSEFFNGMNSVPSGAMVVVKSTSINQSMTLSSPIKINSWSGSTILGAASP